MSPLAHSAVEPVYIYASQTGKPTLDQDGGGGNPFASALEDLLIRDSLTFDVFQKELVELTKRRSGGFQIPEVIAHSDIGVWRLLPKTNRERRVALVVVFSDYSASDNAQCLPGAKHDMQRITVALDRAGFEAQTVLDPDLIKLEIVLREFAVRSIDSEVALLYTTGHGVEVEGHVYLLPGDYPFSQGSAALQEYAVRLTTIGSALRASLINLVLYGGCRDNYFAIQSIPVTEAVEGSAKRTYKTTDYTDFTDR
ncbi:MAG: hypothetical protein GY797_01885 [Deltaproteobacteria bacterium]|nr:hypothetical protein [Deltaproteobacteria bacterium]